MKKILLIASLLLSNKAIAGNTLPYGSLKVCNPNSDFIKNHNQLIDDALDKKRIVNPADISFNSQTATHSVLARQLQKLAKDTDTTVYEAIRDNGLKFISRKSLTRYLHVYEGEDIAVTGAKPNCLMISVYSTALRYNLDYLNFTELPTKEWSPAKR